MISLSLAITMLATAATSFNLVCTGTVSTGEGFKSDKSKTPFSITYRVDLNRDRWCSDRCTSSEPLYGVTNEEIIFRFQKDEDLTIATRVNRESGVYSDLAKLGPGWIHSFGKCQPAPFTGLPGRRF
jgi:hypothetical protein